jgi:hypothetical protein
VTARVYVAAGVLLAISGVAYMVVVVLIGALLSSIR